VRSSSWTISRRARFAMRIVCKSRRQRQTRCPDNSRDERRPRRHQASPRASPPAREPSPGSSGRNQAKRHPASVRSTRPNFGPHHRRQLESVPILAAMACKKPYTSSAPRRKCIPRHHTANSRIHIRSFRLLMVVSRSPAFGRLGLAFSELFPFA